MYFEARRGDFYEYYTSSKRTVYLKGNDGDLDHYFSNFRQEGSSKDEGSVYIICNLEVCMKVHYFPTGFKKAFQLIEQVSKLNLHQNYINGN